MPINAAYLSFEFNECPELSDFKQFIPENVLLGRHDTICAIRSNGRYALEKPFLMPQRPIIIDDLYVYLNPNVAKFEAEFCRLVAEDKSMWDRVEIEPSVISIVERRLKIGVHNGWKYVHEPFLVQLSSDSSPSAGNKNKRLNVKASLKKASEPDESSIS